MMAGYLKQKFQRNISERKVRKALIEANPEYHNRRRNDTARLINPIPYRADYFGHKLHIDQNEKLIRYGVTHVAAIDGHSRFVVAHSTMPIKNNGVIYSDIYKEVSFYIFRINMRLKYDEINRIRRRDL